MQVQEQTEAGKETMRALIQDGGIGKAVATVADMYAAPANYDERDRLAGMILAAYEAGLIAGGNL
jgi:hypothetical protein